MTLKGMASILYARANSLGIWVLGANENVFEAAKTVARLCGV